MNIRKFTFCLLALLMLCSAVSAVAQPTVQGGALPVAGDVFTLTLADTTGVQPGAAGASATWSLGSLTATGLVQIDSFLTPSATPYGGLFATADLAMHEMRPGTNYFVYYDNDGSFLKRIANVQPDTVIYSDPANESPFPLEYNGTANDTYYAHYRTTGGSASQAGTASQTVDGYGTLTLPTGTYTNVLRTHATRNELDTVFGASTTLASQNFEYYNWYQPNSYYPILSITYFTRRVSSLTFHGKSVGYRQGYTGPSAVRDVAADHNAILLYPNPASEKATVVYNAADESVVSIYDMIGRTMQSHTIPSSSGVQTYTLDISALATGVYTVRMINAQGASDTKLQIAR